MTIIKFRGQRKDNGEWFYGSLIELDGRCFIVTSGNGWHYRRYSKSVRDIGIKDVFEVVPETVGQFTGLLDREGKEIYGGDIVLWTRKHWYCPGNPDHNKDLKNRMHIYWNDKEYAFWTDMYDEKRCFGSGGLSFEDERADRNITKIIGNIHESPELLEQLK